MTLRARAWSILSSVGSLVRRGTRRGTHEAQVRRLQWAIDRRKAALGKAVYPLLESGAVQIDVPEVHDELANIRELQERLRELQARLTGNAAAAEAPQGTDQ